MKKLKIGRWIFLAALSALVATVIVGNLGLYRVHRKTQRMQAKVQELNRTIDSLAVEIRRLRADTAYIERIAREKLGMARKDERIYKFVEEPR